MIFKVFLDNGFLFLDKDELHFTGYINKDNRLIYNDAAKDIILSHLKSNPLDSLFDKINGAFRFIYHTDSVIIFSTDHFGGYPLFYKLSESGLELFDNPMLYKHKTPLEDKAISSIFASGFTQVYDTIFTGIFECTPGTLYKYHLRTGKLESKTWFRYISTNIKTFNNKEFAAILETLFPEIESGKYTLSLSGGIDSRLLFSCLLNQNREFKTFSFGSELNQDRYIARELAQHYRIEHEEHDFTPDICSGVYNEADIDFVLNNCTLGRSLPNETDLISSNVLNPETDIIVKGFGGDWVSGRYVTPNLFRMKSQKTMSKYIFNKFFNLTCQSSEAFTKLIGNQFNNILDAYYQLNPHSMISAYEQWNQHHNERKYIVNTLAFYRAKGFKFYLPFYDRYLMNFFAKLRLVEKVDQEAYFTFIRKHFFIGKMAEIRDIPTLRRNFLAPYSTSVAKNLSEMALKWIRTVDRKKIRKRYTPPSLIEFADSLMLFKHNFEVYPYLRKKIRENFPEVTQVAQFLRENGCPRAAAHIEWMAAQKTSQINVNGLSLCKFFFTRQFIDTLKKHIS